jgi:hypothetical protein
MSIHDEIKKAGAGMSSPATAIALLKQVGVEFAEYLGSKDDEWGFVPYDRNRLAIGQAIEEHDFLVTERGRAVTCQMWISADNVPNSGNIVQFPIKAKVAKEIEISLEDIELPMQGDKSSRAPAYASMVSLIKLALAKR